MNGTNVQIFNKEYSIVETKNRIIFDFPINDNNVDRKTVESFGDEWEAFHGFDEEEIQKLGDEYFDIINREMLNESSSVLEVGCGSGRFLKYLSDKAGLVVGVDPSDAVYAANDLLGKKENVILARATANDLPFASESFEF